MGCKWKNPAPSLNWCHRPNHGICIYFIDHRLQEQQKQTIQFKTQGSEPFPGAMKTTPITEMEKTAENVNRLLNHSLHTQLNSLTKDMLKRQSLNHTMKSLRKQRGVQLSYQEILQPAVFCQGRVFAPSHINRRRRRKIPWPRLLGALIFRPVPCLYQLFCCRNLHFNVTTSLIG